MDDAATPIGFIGLGSIGRPMVENLLRAGEAVVVHDLDARVVADLVASGATAADGPADVARRCRLVGVCVPADEHVRAVLDGTDGLLANLAPGSAVAVHSTVLPATVQWAADEARARRITVVEAPVTGGFMAAAEGRSTFLLGGDPADVAAIEPILAACGGARVHAGALGQASRLKLCLNLQTYVTFLGVNEAARLANEVGIGLDPLKAAMAANGQLSELIDTYLLLHELPADTLADANMQGVLAGYAAIIEKDLRLIRRLAEEAGVPIPGGELAADQAPRVYFLEER